MNSPAVPMIRMPMTTNPQGLRCAGFGVDDRDLTIRWTQSLESHQLRLVCFGGFVTVNSLRFRVHPNTVLIVTPNSRVKLEMTPGEGDPWEMIWDFVPCNDPKIEVAVPLLTPLGEQGPFFVKSLQRALDRDLPGFHRYHATMNFLLWHIALPIAEGSKSTMVQDAERFIRENIQRKISVSDIAERLGVSHNTLIRGFRRHHGFPPQQFIRALRLQIAYQQIVNTLTPIKEVASNVGIQDLQHFNHMIQDAYGMSPTRLRFTRNVGGVYLSEEVIDIVPTDS